MRIATYNVNGINGRLTNLLGWLEQAAPGIVCLQELKAPDDKFPEAALRAAGYGAIWHGKRAGTAWPSWLGASNRWKPAEACRAIPTTRTAVTSKRRSTA
jgi:exodeoxyribonuclease-3